MEWLKLNFYKDITKKDGLRIYCKSFTVQHHNNRNEQRNACERQNRETDLYFKVASYIRNRLYKAYKTQNVKKLIKQLIYLDVLLNFLRNGSRINFMVR